MKKFLSLALSLAMVFSMFTFLSIGANAADAKNYTDYSTIQYKEAVDVISALDIMGGYTGGTFGPTGGLTRGAATKIICNMMVGPSTASRLPAPTGTSFSDVPASHTFAATIAYCAEQGFISGYSDGSFHPGDPLSGNAFLKMLLCALGYDQDAEKYRNTSAWATNVVARAVEVGVMDDMPDDFDGRTALTREQAALLALNTLQADMVEYTNNGTTVILGEGSPLVQSTSIARSRTWSSSTTYASNISDKTRSENGQNQNIVQFAELKFNRLVREDQTDDFGRPSVRWTLHGDEIGEYAENVNRTYWGDKAVDDIYKDLSLNNNEYAEFYVNGVRHDNILLEKNPANASADELTELGTNNGRAWGLAEKIGAGTRVDIFFDRDGDSIRPSTPNVNPLTADCRIQVCAVINYAGKVSSVKRATSSDPRKITITFAYDAYKTPTNQSEDTAEFETTSFAADDIVSFTYAGGEIKSVTPLTKVQGGLTRYSRDNNMTINGSQYSYSDMIAFDGALLGDTPNSDGYLEETLSTDNDYVIYLNDRNQIMWVEEVEQSAASDGSSGYALIRWIDSEYYSDRDSNQARLLFTDGSQQTVTLYKDYLKDWYQDDNTFDYSNGPDARLIVHYTRQSNGSYRLTRQTGDNYAASTTMSISSRTISGWDLDDGTSMDSHTDSSTVFIVNDDGNYRRYVGKRNAPNISGGVDAYAYLNNDGTAKYIWIVEAGTISTSSRDITFVAAASRSGVFTEGDDDYRTYNAVVAGDIRTIRVEDGIILNDPANTNRDGENETRLEVAGGDDNSNSNASVIVNNTTTNSDNLVTGAYYNHGSIKVYRAYGVKAPANGEIQVNTNSSFDGTFNGYANSLPKNSYRTLPANLNNVNAYEVDADGNIQRLGSVMDIQADSDAWVFFTENDDDEVTNIFVCENND